ncbi:MAG: ATP-binding protein [Pseudomonadota bacterium]
MTLRRQLLLIALVLAALPVSGWFTAREMQTALRAAEERAGVAAAQPLARAMQSWLPAPAAGRIVLPVHPSDYPRSIDGFADDWQPWFDFAQRFDARTTTLGFELQLVAWQRRLQGLLWVRDRTPGGGGRPADEIQLTFGSGWSFRITADVAGTARVERLDAAGGDVPLSAAWTRDAGRGYRVEFDLPLSLAGGTLDATVLDFGDGLPGSRPVVASTTTGSRPAALRFSEPARIAALETLAAPGTRLWFVDAAGWVLAVTSGEVEASAVGLRGWRRTVYRWLGSEEGGAAGLPEPGMDLRLGDGQITAALAGVSGSRLRIEPDGVRTLTAVPVMAGGTVRGALLAESPGDKLLLVSNRAFAGTVVTAVLAVALVSIGLLAYAGWLSWRIRRLRDAAERVAAGEATALPRVTASDEVGDLARSFERLVGQLDDYNRYLQGLAGRLAHELDTPLSIVRSSLDNLQDEGLPEDARRCVARAREGADRLAGIFRAMREARRLEESVNRAELGPVDLVALVRACTEAYGAVDTAHRWAAVVSHEAAPVTGADELIVQALDKLTDNARSFTPEGGQIELVVRRRGRGWWLGVRDEGPGLPATMAGHLFDSMVSVRDPGDGFHLGLGLHVVRLIAQGHGGKVTARNRRDGAGAEIGLWLPERPREVGTRRPRLVSDGSAAYTP